MIIILEGCNCLLTTPNKLLINNHIEQISLIKNVTEKTKNLC